MTRPATSFPDALREVLEDEPEHDSVADEEDNHDEDIDPLMYFARRIL